MKIILILLALLTMQGMSSSLATPEKEQNKEVTKLLLDKELIIEREVRSARVARENRVMRSDKEIRIARAVRVSRFDTGVRLARAERPSRQVQFVAQLNNEDQLTQIASHDIKSMVKLSVLK